MNIAELKEKVEGCIQNATLTLQASSLGSSGIQEVIYTYFSGKSVIMTDVSLNASDDEVTVMGRIKFFTTSSIQSTIVFSINNAEAELKLTVPLPDSWTFSEFSESIKDGYLNDLIFSTAKLILVSEKQTFPAVLNKGLNFQGQIKSGLPSLVSQLLKSPVFIEGSISLVENGPEMNLWMTPGTSLDFGTLKLPTVYCGFMTFPTPPVSKAKAGLCYQLIQFKSKITIAKDSLAIDGTYSDFNKLLLIETTNQSLSLSNGLKSVFNLIGWTPDINWPSSTFLSDIYLTNLRLLTEIEPASLNSLSFGIECKTDWAFITDTVVLEKIGVGIWINDPLSSSEKQYGGQIYGQFLIGEESNIIIDLYAQMPSSGSKEGWSFFGDTQPGSVLKIGSVLSDISSKFGITLPDVFQKFTLKDVQIGFKTVSKDINCYISLDFEVAEKQIELDVKVLISKSGNVYNRVIEGILLVGNSEFYVTFSEQSGVATFQAKWSDSTDPLELSDIASTFGFTLPSIPQGLDLSLKSASLTYDFTDSTLVMEAESSNYGNAVFVAYISTTTKKWQFYFGLSIDKPVNLSNLPLIDKVLSKNETLAIENLQVLVSSTPLLASNSDEQKEITQINKLIAQGYPSIPEQGLPDTVAISAQFDFGGLIVPLSIGTPAKTTQEGLVVDTKQPVGSSSVGPSSGTNRGTVPTPTSAADGTTWFDIQKSFGPVSFRKIGVKYEDSVLWFLIDASLIASELEISVIGLSVGSPLTSFEPEFNIEGLGIAYSNSVITISGAFEKLASKAPVTLEFAGEVSVQLENTAVAAIGAYAQFEGKTSMFVFANVDGTFGGPGFFFITGFCGGFGYNSKLRIPGQDEVYQFPFVSSLSDSTIFGNNPGPTDVMEKLMDGNDPWLTPSAGDIWLGVGVKFTTYEVVNSTALVTADFGSKFLLSLVGLSQARFPMEGSTVYAYVELQLEALFDPGDGVVSFTADLSPNSFVLDKSCHLTGGFALYYWFGANEHSGDFVLTLGGYSPYFNTPAYYPQEPRLGFNWALDSSISISGSLYFALTPAAVMAGGSLDASYHSGNLKAWFDIHADIIVWYNPFHFIADIGVIVGASYKVDLMFCSTTYHAELGADLTLWGPETGGTVHVHWFIISFTVNFGADRSSELDKQDWSDFIKVLPAPESVVKIQPVTGLQVGAVSSTFDNQQTAMALAGTTADASTKTWVVRAADFQFATESSVPLTELYIGTEETPVKKGDEINIKPMQETGLTVKKTLTIVSEETGENVLDNTWNIEFVTNNVPSALWGKGSCREFPSGSQLVTNQLVGFKIKVPSPTLGDGTGDINIKDDLQYATLKTGLNPLKLGLDSQGPIPEASDQTIADIEKIMSASVKTERDAIYNTFGNLGLNGLTNDNLTNLAEKANIQFVDEPLLIN